MIRSTFHGFEVAKRALSVSQAGLDIVGNNMSNVSTPGYTRQRVDQVSISGNVTTRFQTYGSLHRGQGVLATGISQIRDTTLDARYRAEAADYACNATRVNGLSDLETLFDELEVNGLSVALEEFISLLSKYDFESSSKDNASIMRAQAQTLVQMLNSYANSISNTYDQYKTDLEGSITKELNVMLESVALLNDKIREAHIYGDPANELMDQRNLLLDQISEYANVKVVETTEEISSDISVTKLSVVMMDYSTYPPGEYTLVNGRDYNTLGVVERDNGTVGIQLLTDYGAVINDDITGNFTTGAIRGYLDLLNGMGSFATDGDNTFRGFQYYQMALDTFAQTFAETMNRMNAITAQDEADALKDLMEQLGGDYVDQKYVYEYDPKDLFASTDGGKITASNITLSSNWLNDPTFITVSKSNPAEEEPTQAKDENGNLLFDAQGNPIWENTDRSDALDAMIETLKGKNYFTITDRGGNQKTLYAGSFSDFLVSGIQTDLGTDNNLYTTLLTANEAAITNYANLRDSVSAVNIDEEAINMMLYQNYFTAASRYMTTVDEALGTIIQSMGVVGR